MTLRKYLSRGDTPNLTALSAMIGVTKGRLSQLQDSTDWPPELALEAEKQTNGGLDAAQLSPVIARARSTSAEAA